MTATIILGDVAGAKSGRKNRDMKKHGGYSVTVWF